MSDSDETAGPADALPGSPHGGDAEVSEEFSGTDCRCCQFRRYCPLCGREIRILTQAGLLEIVERLARRAGQSLVPNDKHD